MDIIDASTVIEQSAFLEQVEGRPLAMSSPKKVRRAAGISARLS